MSKNSIYRWQEWLFECVDAIKPKYGKHTLFLGSSFLVHQQTQHEGTPSAVLERRRELFKGETKRKRLAIRQRSA